MGSLISQQTGLTERQRAFARLVASGLEKDVAATRAGYAGPNEAWRLLQLPHVLAAVHLEVQRAIQAEAAVSLEVLREIRNDKTAPARVRADISALLLKMAGHIVPTTRPDAPDKSLSDMTREEMLAFIDRNQAEIDRAEQELAARAKPVSAQDTAQKLVTIEAKPLPFLD